MVRSALWEGTKVRPAARRVYAQLPHGELLMLPDATHQDILQHPQALARIVEHLQGNAAAAADSARKN